MASHLTSPRFASPRLTLTPGGQDFKATKPGRALTYVQLLSLSVHNVEVLVGTYPEEAKKIKRMAWWMAAQKFILQYAVDVKNTRYVPSATRVEYVAGLACNCP